MFCHFFWVQLHICPFPFCRIIINMQTHCNTPYLKNQLHWYPHSLSICHDASLFLFIDKIVYKNVFISNFSHLILHLSLTYTHTHTDGQLLFKISKYNIHLQKDSKSRTATTINRRPTEQSQHLRSPLICSSWFYSCYTPKLTILNFT